MRDSWKQHTIEYGGSDTEDIDAKIDHVHSWVGYTSYTHITTIRSL